MARQQQCRTFTERISKLLLQPLENDSDEVGLEVAAVRERLKSLVTELQEKNEEASLQCE